MFEEIFSKVYEQNSEIKVIGVWGKDGLELEKKFYEDIPDFDLEFSGAELADILTKLDNTRVSPENFLVRLKVGKYDMLLFSLTSEYFLIILGGSGIITGKLSFYLNLYREQMASAL